MEPLWIFSRFCSFWFGLTVGPETPSIQAGLWWSKQPEIDLQIRQKFADGLQALAWCLEGIDKQQDLQLEPVERVFFYLPLEHAEDIEMQDLSCRKFSDLLDDNINYQVTPSDGTYEGFYRFAERHRDVIQKFGRFPHRNKILGRTSSEQEQEYLNTPGSGF